LFLCLLIWYRSSRGRETTLPPTTRRTLRWISAPRTISMASTENDFDGVNRVRCFNHTMNLAVKSFMRPFQPRPKKKDASGNLIEGDDDASLEEPIIDLDEDGEDDDSIPELEELSDTSSVASADVDGDAFDDLGAEKQAEMLRETKEAKTAVSLVRRIFCSVF
ncbi:hypothetical protein B0H10DRAFT_2300711, partial [Mycena sp. CBHHK59/15]